MAEFTENFNLEKPAQEDFYNIDVQNRNMDIIDEALAAAGNNETNDRIDTNVTDIKDKVGSTADTGGTTTAGSIFAKLNAILHQFLSYWTPARAQKLDASVSNEVWTDARAEKLDKLDTLLSRGCVKSVQKGWSKGKYSDGNRTINISSVTPSKCLVILKDSVNSSSSGKQYGSLLLSLSSTQLSITANGYSDGDEYSTSWQVIEFY
jgi:hypothetical protein